MTETLVISGQNPVTCGGAVRAAAARTQACRAPECSRPGAGRGETYRPRRGRLSRWHERAHPRREQADSRLGTETPDATCAAAGRWHPGQPFCSRTRPGNDPFVAATLDQRQPFAANGAGAFGRTSRGCSTRRGCRTSGARRAAAAGPGAPAGAGPAHPRPGEGPAHAQRREWYAGARGTRGWSARPLSRREEGRPRGRSPRLVRPAQDARSRAASRSPR